jgi:hypothetical protein
LSDLAYLQIVERGQGITILCILPYHHSVTYALH